jgi:hypothetical protein
MRSPAVAPLLYILVGLVIALLVVLTASSPEGDRAVAEPKDLAALMSDRLARLVARTPVRDAVTQLARATPAVAPALVDIFSTLRASRFRFDMGDDLLNADNEAATCVDRPATPSASASATAAAPPPPPPLLPATTVRGGGGSMRSDASAAAVAVDVPARSYPASDKSAREAAAAFLRRVVPPLDGSGHKGSGGRVGVLGGSVDYTGAPFYAVSE